MRPISLRLKGFKGIRAGMGLDEVTINFNDLPAGIVAFAARNGGGKTTILDSMTPYRMMVYRMNGRDSNYKPTAFSYYEQTDGDAEKEFIFEVDGETYRSLVVIDTPRKKQEAYLYYKDDDIGARWVLMPGIDGKLDNYDQAVERLVGSPELFFSSIFRAQNAKALSDYAKGDIKSLFIELLNIEHLQAISEKARRVKQHLAGKVETLMYERSRLKTIVDGETGKQAELDTASLTIGTSAKAIEAAKDQIATAQAEINQCEVKIGMEKERSDQAAKAQEDLTKKEMEKADLEADIAGIRNRYGEKINVLTGKITEAERLAGQRKNVQAYIDAKTGFETKLEGHKKTLAEVGAEIDRLTGEITKVQETEGKIKDLEKDLLSVESEWKLNTDLARKTLEDAQRDADKLKGTPCSEPIAVQCRFVKDAVAAKNNIPTYKKNLEDALVHDPREQELRTQIETLKATLQDKTALQEQLTEKRTAKTEQETAIKALEEKLSNAQKALVMLPKIELAEKQVPELKADKEGLEKEREEEIGKVDKKIQALAEETEELTFSILDLTDTESAGERKKELTELVETLTGQIEEHTREKEEAQKTIGAIEQAFKEIDKAKTDLEVANARITYLNNEMSQWAVLEKAFGNDGIIALELDDAGPQVAAYANELLKEYGGRFQVRIDTQIAKSDGKGNKETFDISVFDNETNEIKSIRKMSGGEKTWIEDSMTKAIALYLAGTSGRKYDATFSDEKDGALDPAKKKEFFAAMRRALDLGGYRNLYAITQTPELQAMADAVIRLEQGKVEIVTN